MNRTQIDSFFRSHGWPARVIIHGSLLQVYVHPFVTRETCRHLMHTAPGLTIDVRPMRWWHYLQLGRALVHITETRTSFWARHFGG